MKLRVGVLMLLIACTPDPEPEPVNVLERCLDVEGECKSSSCGGNSVAINAFPIQGFRPTGECSNEGAQLVPGSLEAPDPASKCNGATLDVVGDKFVGRGKDKAIACQDNDLIGATFEVRGKAIGTLEGVRARIKIAKITPYKVLDREVTAYRLESNNEGLCHGATAAKLRKTLHLSTIPLHEELTSVLERDLVIPVRAERYDRYSHRSTDGLWFHFACVEDALAKRTLYGLQTGDLARDEAMLRMLTADYCGNVPVTRRGVEVDWKTGTNIEALWTPSGASCLSNPRLLYTNGPTPTVPADLPPRLRCTDPANCTPASWIAQMQKCANRTLQPCPATYASNVQASYIPAGPP